MKRISLLFLIAMFALAALTVSGDEDQVQNTDAKNPEKTDTPPAAEEKKEETVEPQKIDALIDGLENKDEHEREKAYRELKAIGAPALARILEYGFAEKHHPTVLANLIRLLGGMSGPESIKKIEYYLKSNIAELRIAAMDAAFQTGDQKLIFGMTAMLTSENELVRRKAIFILSKSGFKQTVTGLSELLKNKYPHVKIQALEELRNFPEMKDIVIEDVAALLEEDNPRLVLEAAVTLKTFKDKRGEDFFAHTLLEKDRSFQEQSIRYIGKYKIENAVPFLLKMLKADNWYTRYLVIDALGEIRSPLALPSLKILFDEEQVHPVRIALARVFYRFKSPELLEFLKHKITVEKDVDVRWFIVATIGEIGTEQAIEPLINTLMDSDEKVRLAAIMALRKITDQYFEYDPRKSNKERSETLKRWTNWFKSNKKQ